MEPFEVNGRCPKCGCVGATTEYQRANLDAGNVERLKRKCTTCGAVRYEAPVDSEPF